MPPALYRSQGSKVQLVGFTLRGKNPSGEINPFHHLRLMAETIEDLTLAIRAFRDARDWKQFHAPKEMAVAIAAEAGELLQHFVWQSPTQSEVRAVERREEIASEIADVGILLFEMADNLGINLAAAMRQKLAKNELRYPVDKARGSNRKYNEL
jgi:dCTP diphosphatase